MPKLSKAINRDRKKKNSSKHVVDNRNIFLLEEIKKKKAEKAKAKKRKHYEDLREISEAGEE